MTRDAKRRHQDTAVDRISTLPRNLIDLILQCLPVRDAARTSILSRVWRNIWGTHPQLIFNDAFFADIISKYNKKARLSQVSKIISSVLLVHSGPILKFHLSIPADLSLHQIPDMHLWIKNISNNGVRELEFSNNTRLAYDMPSYLFSCLQLTDLSLSGCILNPLLRFGGFCNLSSVELKGVTITAEMTFGAQLKELNLNECTGVEHLGCQFISNNNLTKLVIMDSVEIDWRWFECTHKVKSLVLILNDENNEKVIDFDKLVGNMPDICALGIDNSLLQLLEPGAANLKKLKTSIENLKYLYLYTIEFCSLHQIQYALCLIQSSPNLRGLHILVEDNLGDTMSVAAVEQYLQLPNFTGMILDKLETVEIEEMVGSKAELQLIKLLLTSSPSLRWMKLKYNSERVGSQKELLILRELVHFSRASTSAHIITN